MILPAELKALIVDDNAYARSAVAATLRKLGLSDIVELERAAAVVPALLATRFDVLFLDWYMPEMNGAALLEIIRDPRFGPNGRVPVIMVTAYPSREAFARARELGANEVLPKPFTLAHASTAISRALPGTATASEPGQVLL